MTLNLASIQSALGQAGQEIGLILTPANLERAAAVVNGLIAFGQSAVAAEPVIAAGVADFMPLARAVMTLIARGGAPTADEWAFLEADIVQNSADIAAQAAKARAELSGE